jgi:hypothetical protein
MRTILGFLFPFPVYRAKDLELLLQAMKRSGWIAGDKIWEMQVKKKPALKRKVPR